MVYYFSCTPDSPVWGSLRLSQILILFCTDLTPQPTPVASLSAAFPPEIRTKALTTASPSTTIARPLEGGELKARIDTIKESFENFVQSIQNSFSTRDFPLQKIQNCLKFVPLDLRLQLGGNFHDRVLHFLVATNITPKQFFFEFSYFWDYLNPGLLCFFVERYGSSEDKELMKTYKQELKAFRICTPVGEFVKVAGADITINRGFYKKIIMKMDPEWENKTLEDAEEFKIDFL